MKFSNMLLSWAKGLGKKRCSEFTFSLPQEPFGAKDTERCIEIPWAISCYRGEKRVLDIGYANAEERYLRELFSLNIPELYGLDLVRKDLDGISSVVGDIRDTGLPDGFFDLVLCISTIEHIGRDNTIYCSGCCEDDDRGDFDAIEEICRITRPGGRLALTFPYGRLYNYGWFIHYDESRWSRLLRASGCSLLAEQVFIYREGWRHSSKAELEGVLYKDNNAPAAAGLMCALLEKPY